MSPGYCVLIGPVDHGRRAAEEGKLARQNLPLLFEIPSVRIFASADQSRVILPGGRGVVLGHLFAREGHLTTERVLDCLPQQDDAARWMIDQMWGRYLAILVGGSAAVADLLRDPTGLMPCFSATRDGVTAFAPDARTLHYLDVIDGTIDWPTAASPLAYPDLRLARTALVGVSDPTPGQVVRIGTSGASRDTLWMPSHFCRNRRDISFDDAAGALRSTFDTIMAAWTAACGKILLSLSGGLDSSIIATSVPAPQTNLVAFTMRSGHGRGDERDYARTLAHAISVDLEELDLTRETVDPTMSAAADLPNALARSFSQPADRFAAALANRVGATVHMTGGGGDNVLAYLHSANPAADQLRHRGPGRDFLGTVSDLAKLTQCTAPYVAWRAISKAWFQPDRYRWPKTADLLTADYLGTLAEIDHPWLADQETLPPGQREHVALIARAMFYVYHLNIRDHRPTIYPLLSQPLVELCLSLPTWLSCRNGRDRAVARAAFSDRIPQVIVDRQTKGTFDGILSGILERHRTRIRQMILDGALVREGIINRTAAEHALGARTFASPTGIRLLHCADIEAWAAAWGG